MKLNKVFMAATLSIILMLTCTSLMAEWSTFDRSTPDVTHYIDFDNIQRAEDKATLWQLTSFKTAQFGSGVRYSSVKALFEFDCTVKLFRIIEAVAYSKAMGEGSVVDKDPDQNSEWSAIPPNSNGVYLWQTACKKHTNIPVTDTNITGITNGNKKNNIAIEGNGLAKFAQQKSTLMSKYDPLTNEARTNEERLLDEILITISPNHFMEYNAEKKAKHLISEYKSIALKIHYLNISFAKEMKIITAESLKYDFTKTSLDELNKSNDELISIFEELTEIRHEKSNIFLKIIKLIESNKSRIKVLDGLFVFEEQSTLQLFNQYTNDLEHAANKEENTMEMLLQNRREFIDKLLGPTSVSTIKKMPLAERNENPIAPEPKFQPVQSLSAERTTFDWDSLTVPKLNNYIPREYTLPEIDPEGSVFMANLAEYTIWGALMNRRSSRDLSKVNIDEFNALEHLRPDQLPDLEYYALDMSQEEIDETSAQLSRARKNKRIIAAHPYKSFLILLVLNSPFLALAAITIISFIRKHRIKNKII